ncbi:hypothetical protein [Novosphingobium sp.]|uniref:hypothetical protein n=1 Tax=Novosphingobium sp. TaxID=1874826 RepID=UPI0025DF8AAA|nr:hypothetical protein [Novosphingobium sp.]
MMEAKTVECAAEYLPSLDQELDTPDQVSVKLDIKIHGGTLNFIMIDTTPWPEGSDGRAVTTDADGNTCLVVERRQDRIFTFDLSPDWRWTFDTKANSAGAPLTFKRGDARLYRVTDVTEKQLVIHAKARPNMPTGGARDNFNLYVLMDQDKGEAIPLRIDPTTDNPPDHP